MTLAGVWQCGTAWKRRVSRPHRLVAWNSRWSRIDRYLPNPRNIAVGVTRFISQGDSNFNRKGMIMRFFAFIAGFLILIAGLAWAAIEAGAPPLYVQIGALILLGVGIITAASQSRVISRQPQDVTVVRDTDPL